MTIDETTRVKSAHHVFDREFEGELVLLDLAKGDYYGLDPLGAALWRGVTRGRSIAELAPELVREWDVDPMTLTRDLVALLSDLVARGLLERIEPSSAPSNSGG
jgi:hypothetical protein